MTYVRLWADGPAGRARMSAEICETLGTLRGHRIIALWAEFLETYQRYQPYERAGLAFDETEFADFLAIAADAEREHVLVRAISLVRPDAVLLVTNLATQLGLSFRQILLRRAALPKSTAQALH